MVDSTPLFRNRRLPASIALAGEDGKGAATGAAKVAFVPRQPTQINVLSSQGYAVDPVAQPRDDGRFKVGIENKPVAGNLLTFHPPGATDEKGADVARFACRSIAGEYRMSFWKRVFGMAGQKNWAAEVDASNKTIDFVTKKYQVELDTSLGKIVLDFLPDVAPGHCRNLISLAKLGYYDNLIFHRVIAGFMIQGGCPEGSGGGGPGYKIKAEFNATPHEPGVLSMARTSDPNSAGSQFFICLEKCDFLDNNYTAFGRTADAESLAVVRKIGAVPTASERPKTPVTIKTAKVVETAK